VEVLTGNELVPHGTAFEGQFYPGRLKNRSSQAPIGVPLQVRPIINAWKRVCADPSPEALMFPTFGRGKRKGQAVPRWGKNFLRLAYSADCQEARDLGSSRHLSGDAAHAGDRSAEARFTEGRSRGATPCEHQDHGRRVRADDRGECPECNELSDDGYSCRLGASCPHRWRRNRGRRRRGKSGAANQSRSRNNWTKLDQV
jgi:hypothetical protein